MRQRDVLIVGAGPAGSWAAYRLARLGARVQLFDASHPREKPCGGGLTGRTLQLVQEAVPLDRLPLVAARTLRFESTGGASEFPLSPSEPNPAAALAIVDRRTFDGALLDAARHAGADHISQRVRAVRALRDGVEIETACGRWRGDVLVGADGATSLVRRSVAGPLAPAQLSIATGWYVRGRTSTEVCVRTIARPPGYIWSFPRADHLAIGICAQADVTNVTTLRRVLAGWLRESGLGDGECLERYAWPIPSLSSLDFSRQRPAGDRWMLVGDAAGLVDPLTREGIYYAVASAELAAAAVAAGRPAGHAERLHDEVYPELARAADVKARFFTSGFSDLMVRGFQQSGAVRDVMVDLVAGRQPYSTLKRRLLMTFQVGLACRLLWLQISGRRAESRRTPASATAPR